MDSTQTPASPSSASQRFVAGTKKNPVPAAVAGAGGLLGVALLLINTLAANAEPMAKIADMLRGLGFLGAVGLFAVLLVAAALIVWADRRGDAATERHERRHQELVTSFSGIADKLATSVGNLSTNVTTLATKVDKIEGAVNEMRVRLDERTGPYRRPALPTNPAPSQVPAK